MTTSINKTLAELGILRRLTEGRGLAVCEEPDHLVVAEIGKNGCQHRLAPDASNAWKAMKREAGDDGLELFIQSAYRSVTRQVEIIRAKLDRGEQPDEILRISAPPGFSEHHTGRAVDLATPACMRLERDFDQTPAFRWLRQHAKRFGFALSYPPDNAQGFQYEPWHWCYMSPES